MDDGRDGVSLGGKREGNGGEGRGKVRVQKKKRKECESEKEIGSISSLSLFLWRRAIPPLMQDGEKVGGVEAE